MHYLEHRKDVLLLWDYGNFCVMTVLSGLNDLYCANLCIAFAWSIFIASINYEIFFQIYYTVECSVACLQYVLGLSGQHHTCDFISQTIPSFSVQHYKLGWAWLRGCSICCPEIGGCLSWKCIISMAKSIRGMLLVCCREMVHISESSLREVPL